MGTWYLRPWTWHQKTILQNLIATAFVSMLTQGALAQTKVLSLEEYRQVVRQTNHGLRKTQKELEVAKENRKSIDLATSTQLTSNATILRSKQGSDSFPSYSAMDSEMVGVGLEQQFRFGTKAAVNFEWQKSKLYDMTPFPGVPASQVEGAQFTPSIAVSQSLWQNGFGRSLDLQDDSLRLMEEASSLAHQSQEKMASLEADLTYYRLVFARDRVTIAKRTLENAEKILDYVSNKYDKNLYEKSDLLQAQALASSRQLELQSAETELYAAAVAFNSLRGESSSVVTEATESLQSVTPAENPQHLDAMNRLELKRLDTQIQALSRSADLEEDKSKPTLDAFIKYSVKSEQEKLGDATSKVSNPYNPQTAVGLTFRMTLDRDLAETGARSARLQREALVEQMNEVKQNFNKELQTLTEKLKRATDTFKIAKRLEDLQKARVENEQREFRNGRSTTYQMLLAMQDLAQAELGRLQTAYEIKSTKVQLALYKGDQK